MPNAFALGPVLIPTLPAAIIVSLVLAVWTSGRLAAWSALEARWALRVVEHSAWIGLAGARLGFAAANWSAYRDAPWTALYFWQPGYFPYAGVMLGTAFAFWRLNRRPLRERLPYLRVLAGGYLAGALMLAGIVLSLQFLAAPDVPRKGDRVADFTLENLAGEKVRLSDLRGRAVVLNFWATWCAPCRREMPLLDSVQKAYAPRGLVIIGVALDEPPAAVNAFVNSMGVTYPIWVDAPPSKPGYDQTRSVYARFGGVGLPTTFFIDPRGEIQSSHVGELNRAILQVRIEALLRRPQSKSESRRQRVAMSTHIYLRDPQGTQLSDC